MPFRRGFAASQSSENKILNPGVKNAFQSKEAARPHGDCGFAMISGEGMAPTLSIASKDAGKLTPSTADEYAEPESRISLILAISNKITDEVQTLSLPSVDGVYDPDDEAALAWIQQSLEDVEATLRAITPP